MATLAGALGETIQLAQEAPFAIGPLRVTPALRQVEWDDERRTLEPRVMQVLVALGREPEAIVGRDTLVERCWDGRIVGENAIQRTISLIRHLAAETGAFEIETITKVGYRLKPSGAAAAPTPAPVLARPDRRALIAGAGALILATAGGGWLALPAPAREEAERLRAAGLAIQRRDGPSGVRQAIAFFERAVRADPSFATGWGDLAYARVELLNSTSEVEQDPVIAQIRAEAGRALELDPRNPQALLTLALIKPNFRNWIEVEREVRSALNRMPDEPELRQRLGVLHSDTGRSRAAAAEFQWLFDREPLVPANPIQLARARWYMGDTRRAGELLAEARRLWPLDAPVWLAQFSFLVMTGRAGRALAMARDGALGMGIQSPLAAEVGLSTARALANGNEADRQAAVTAILEARKIGRVGSFIAIPFLTLLDATEEAWQAIYAYYFGKRDPQSGERLPLPTMAWRRTDILFAPPAAPLRADPRFPKLTNAIGLDAYWRATGTRPDAV